MKAKFEILGYEILLVFQVLQGEKFYNNVLYVFWFFILFQKIIMEKWQGIFAGF